MFNNFYIISSLLNSLIFQIIQILEFLDCFSFEFFLEPTQKKEQCF
jgi:hypothetical protein